MGKLRDFLSGVKVIHLRTNRFITVIIGQKRQCSQSVKQNILIISSSISNLHRKCTNVSNALARNTILHDSRYARRTGKQFLNMAALLA